MDDLKEGRTFDDTGVNLLTVSKEGVLALLLELYDKNHLVRMIPNKLEGATLIGFLNV